MAAYQRRGVSAITSYPYIITYWSLRELNGIETVRNQLSYMNVYACRCWARDVTVDGYNTPSEYCGGQIIISVTEIVVLGEPGYEVRVKIGHDDDEQA